MHSRCHNIFIFRFDLNDKRQQKRLEDMDKVFSEFGPASPSTAALMLLPTFVSKAFGVGDKMKQRVHNFFRGAIHQFVIIILNSDS
jgi:hypothetical protein